MNVAFKVDLPKDTIYSRVMSPVEPDDLDQVREDTMLAMSEMVRDYIKDNIVTMISHDEKAVDSGG
jgi:hypothetical protein